MSNQALLQELLATDRIRLQTSDFYSGVPAPGLRSWQRVEGMMLGLAIGDSLGNPAESQSPGRRRSRHGEVRDYLRAEGGLPSDDTQLAFWTLEQTLEDGSLIPGNLARRFCHGRIYGLGSAFRQFLGRFKESGDWLSAGVPSAGNGALMRIAPVLIPHLRNPSPELWADVALAGMITHQDTASLSSCMAFTALLWDLLAREEAPAGEDWARLFLEVVRQVEVPTLYKARGGNYAEESPRRFSELLESRLESAWSRDLTSLEACEEFQSGAYLVETVPCVLYLLMRHGHNPEEAIVRAVNDTRDNDTVAAIVGAAVGALHGVRALPARWVQGLTGRTMDHDDGRVFELLAQAQAKWAVPESLL